MRSGRKENETMRRKFKLEFNNELSKSFADLLANINTPEKADLVVAAADRGLADVRASFGVSADDGGNAYWAVRNAFAAFADTVSEIIERETGCENAFPPSLWPDIRRIAALLGDRAGATAAYAAVLHSRCFIVPDLPRSLSVTENAVMDAAVRAIQLIALRIEATVNAMEVVK